MKRIVFLSLSLALFGSLFAQIDSWTIDKYNSFKKNKKMTYD